MKIIVLFCLKNKRVNFGYKKEINTYDKNFNNICCIIEYKITKENMVELHTIRQYRTTILS